MLNFFRKKEYPKIQFLEGENFPPGYPVLSFRFISADGDEFRVERIPPALYQTGSGLEPDGPIAVNGGGIVAADYDDDPLIGSSTLLFYTPPGAQEISEVSFKELFEALRDRGAIIPGSYDE